MPHEPTDACHREHCYTHNEDEPIQAGDYILCGECMHIFRTPEELIAAYVDGYPEDAEHPKPDAANVDADKLTFCPHCIHDF